MFSEVQKGASHLLILYYLFSYVEHIWVFPYFLLCSYCLLHYLVCVCVCVFHMCHPDAAAARFVL